MITTLNRRDRGPPEGECILRVDRATAEDDAIVWSFIVNAGPCAGSQLRHVTPLDQGRLWRLRNLLETLGIEVREDGPTPLDLNEFAGRTLGSLVRDGEIVDFWAVDEDAAKDENAEFTRRTKGEVDQARAALDAALDRYVAARIADSEDIERWQWRGRGAAAR